MRITWNFHSNFSIEYAGSKIIIDPFFADGGENNATRRDITDGTTHVLLTSGHDDHIGNALEICQENKAILVSNYEIALFMVNKGLSDDLINPGNPGGTVQCGSFSTSLVQAVGSSSTQHENGSIGYLGCPVGFVLHAANEKTVYYMGDTDVFSDMALINELHQPDIGIVPIGDRFTMGGALAAYACRKFFNFTSIIPCHYASFPSVDANADAFLAAMENEANKVHVLTQGRAQQF